jgi:hypothetical protein
MKNYTYNSMNNGGGKPMAEHKKFGIKFEVIPKDFLLAVLIASGVVLGDLILRYIGG